MGKQLLVGGKAAFLSTAAADSSWQLVLEGEAGGPCQTLGSCSLPAPGDRQSQSQAEASPEAPIPAVSVLPAVMFSASRYPRTKLDPGLQVSRGKAPLREPLSRAARRLCIPHTELGCPRNRRESRHSLATSPATSLATSPFPRLARGPRGHVPVCPPALTPEETRPQGNEQRGCPPP